MEFLAIVTLTFTAPSNMVGLQMETIDPVRCAEYIDGALAELNDHGVTADAHCRYTVAPASSPIPRPRPQQ